MSFLGYYGLNFHLIKSNYDIFAIILVIAFQDFQLIIVYFLVLKHTITFLIEVNYYTTILIFLIIINFIKFAPYNLKFYQTVIFKIKIIKIYFINNYFTLATTVVPKEPPNFIIIIKLPITSNRVKIKFPQLSITKPTSFN